MQKFVYMEESWRPTECTYTQQAMQDPKWVHTSYKYIDPKLDMDQTMKIKIQSDEQIR